MIYNVNVIKNMNQATLFKIIDGTLSSIGFKAKGKIWMREGKEVSERVVFQKSLYGRFYYFRPSYVLNNLEVTDRYNGHVVMETGLSIAEFRQLESFCNLENDITDTVIEEQLPFLLKKAFSVKRIDSEQALKDYLIESGTFVTKDVLDYLRIENIPSQFSPYSFYDNDGNHVLFTNVKAQGDNLSFDVYVDEDEKNIEENQEKVYQNYLLNRQEIEEAVRKVIFSEFKLSEDFDLSSRFRASSIIVTCDGNCGIAIVDTTYEMGHNRFKFVIETEPDYEFTDSEEYYIETK